MTRNSHKPLLVVSSFRTGSTWLWSRFREVNDIIAYYEIFHERLSMTNDDDISRFTSDFWPSHHGSHIRYFEEYRDFLEPSGGVRSYEKKMAYDWLIPLNETKPRLRPEEQKYLFELVTYAQTKQLFPVLTCNRALLRAPLIKECINSNVILLTRNPVFQWVSYLRLRQSGVDYFLRSAARCIRQCILEPDMKLAMRHFLPTSVSDNADLIPQMSLDEAWIAFVGLHLIYYSVALPVSEVVLDLEQLAQSPDYAHRAAKDVSRLIGRRIQLSGAQPSQPLPSDVARQVTRSHAQLEHCVHGFLADQVSSKHIANFAIPMLDSIDYFSKHNHTSSIGTEYCASDGRIAMERRIAQRSGPAVQFERELDSLENDLFHPSFEFWTNATL